MRFVGRFAIYIAAVLCISAVATAAQLYFHWPTPKGNQALAWMASGALAEKVRKWAWSVRSSHERRVMAMRARLDEATQAIYPDKRSSDRFGAISSVVGSPASPWH